MVKVRECHGMKITEDRVGKNLHSDMVYYESSGTDLIWVEISVNTGRINKVKVYVVQLCYISVGKCQKKKKTSQT